MAKGTVAQALLEPEPFALMLRAAEPLACPLALITALRLGLWLPQLEAEVEAQLLREAEPLPLIVLLTHDVGAPLAEPQPEDEGLAEEDRLLLLQPELLPEAEGHALAAPVCEAAPVPLRSPLTDGLELELREMLTVGLELLVRLCKGEMLPLLVALAQALRVGLVEAQPVGDGLADAQRLALLQPLLLRVSMEVWVAPECENKPVPLCVPLDDTHPLRSAEGEAEAVPKADAVARAGVGLAQGLGEPLPLPLFEALEHIEVDTLLEAQLDSVELALVLREALTVPLPLRLRLWQGEQLPLAVTLLQALGALLADTLPEGEGDCNAERLELLQPLPLREAEAQALVEPVREARAVLDGDPLAETHPLRRAVADPEAVPREVGVACSGVALAQGLGKALPLPLLEALAQREGEALPEAQPDSVVLPLALGVTLLLPLLLLLWLSWPLALELPEALRLRDPQAVEVPVLLSLPEALAHRLLTAEADGVAQKLPPGVVVRVPVEKADGVGLLQLLALPVPPLLMVAA